MARSVVIHFAVGFLDGVGRSYSYMLGLTFSRLEESALVIADCFSWMRYVYSPVLSLC